MKFTPYLQQLEQWPEDGKHIMAQYDDDSIIVYQAYNPDIGLWAVEHQHFGGSFRFTRMSWIKPNFLWMMYRSGWGQKTNQEITLAITLKRSFFDDLLLAAYPSSNILGIDQSEWQRKIGKTNVRLQWDPDHSPYGNPIKRRAIQLGLRGPYLEGFKGDAIISITNLSAFVKEQHQHVEQRQLDQLLCPEERAYPITDDMRKTLGMTINTKHE